MGANSDPIIAYIATFDSPARAKLEEIDSILSEVLPNAERKIAWRMPTFKMRKNIIHFAGFKHHVGLYPGAEAIEHFSLQIQEAGFNHSKGAVQFPYESQLPAELIQSIARWCLAHTE